MKPGLPPTAIRWMKFAAIPLVALAIGVAVAVASSPSSLSRQHALGTPVPASPTVTPVTETPLPSVTEPGILGKGPQLLAVDAQAFAGGTANKAMGSANAGKTWTTIAP